MAVSAVEREVRIHSTIVVYPRPLTCPTCQAFLFRGEGTQAQTRNLTGERTFKGVKHFRPGDDPRSIHWKKTAQRNKLVVKDYLYHQSGENIFVLPEGPPDPEFELTLSRLTFCILQAFRRGHPVGLRHGENFIEPGHGFGHRQKILTYAALVNL